MWSERVIVSLIAAGAGVLISVMVCLTIIALREDGTVSTTIVTAMLGVISLVGSLAGMLFGTHLGSQNSIQAAKQANSDSKAAGGGA